jgi:hypothetical protein
MLTGCGATASAWVLPKPTRTPVTATPPRSENPPSIEECGTAFPKTGHLQQLGDLVISKPALGGLTYPGATLPNDIPSHQPFHLSHEQNTAGILDEHGYVRDPGIVLANPRFSMMGQGSYLVYICNLSPVHSYQLQHAVAKVDTLLLDTSQHPNVQDGCDSAFSSKQRSTYAGCGGSDAGEYNLFKVTWPQTVQSGTMVNPIDQIDNATGSSSPPLTAVPYTLAPGKTYMLVVTMEYPALTGTYTFAFGVQTNEGLALSTATDPVFLEKNAATWSGASCWQNYQAVIPTTTTDQFYVCPDTGNA